MRPGSLRILIGIAFIIGGFVFTVVSRNRANGQGGYIVYYGLYLVGVWFAATGAYTAHRADQAVKEYLRRHPDAT